MAVIPPPDLIDGLRSLEPPRRPGLRWTTEAQWHVTLKFFAAVDSDALVSALDSWAGARPGLPAAVAVAGPTPRAMARRVWTLPVQGLEALAGAVEAATARLRGDSAGDGDSQDGPYVPGWVGPADAGPGAGPADSRPGVGPADSRPGVGPVGGPSPRPSRRWGPPRPFRGHLTLARARYPSALSQLPRPHISVRWQVQEVMVVRSELRHDGARHEVLRRWPLPQS